MSALTYCLTRFTRAANRRRVIRLITSSHLQRDACPLCVTRGAIACWFSRCTAFLSSLVRQHPARVSVLTRQEWFERTADAHRQRASTSRVTNVIIYHLPQRVIYCLTMALYINNEILCHARTVIIQIKRRLAFAVKFNRRHRDSLR